MKISQFFIFTLLISSNVFSADSMKPGLWENTINMKSASGKMEAAMNQMKENMKQMPTDQRKMMEEMMAKQGYGTKGNSTIVKSCVTKEQAENLEIPQDKNDPCTREVISRSKSTVKVKFTCKNNGTGTGEFTLDSPTAFRIVADIAGDINGQKEQINFNQTGKWLSADCGNIRPHEIKK
ncbi:MAG: DUF3617 domain-containing protein [Bdellovibrionales bacterium]|nr:DUF3617 domain-containing protein [Bdellovibrionales bacterium]